MSRIEYEFPPPKWWQFWKPWPRKTTYYSNARWRKK
jgi:hypothetical protein